MRGRAGAEATTAPARARLGRLGAIVLVVALFAGIFAVSRANNWRRWRDPRLGVSGRYPASWYAHPFDDNLGLATHTGVMFSNVEHRFDYPDLPKGSSTSAWDYRALPDDAVVVEVSNTVRLVLPCKHTSSFPLSMADAERTVDHPSYGAPPRLFILACIEGHSSLDVHVLVFPNASAEDRGAAKELVESIRPLVGDAAIVSGLGPSALGGAVTIAGVP